MEILLAALSLAKNNPDLIKDGVKFAIAWFLLKGEVKKQFSGVTAAIDKLTGALTALKTEHDLRITNLEDDMKELKKQHAG